MGETILTYTKEIEQLNITLAERYMGIKEGEAKGSLKDIIDKCSELFIKEIKPKACFLETDVKIENDNVDFGYLTVKSKVLANLLRGCNKAVLVCATIGINADLIVKRAQISSKAEALVYNSLGIAAIEQFMTDFNMMLKEKYSGFELRPRFSPGYADVPLSIQTELLRVLDANRKIGVALSESLLMTPSKSVSAFIGIGNEGCFHIDKDCDICNKKDCEYRLS